eukprot:CAMPEP_0172545526 /NCGR_PEP_ID=MMETSP1067-20121228/15424_1 /TAXON_ID=265564 ORGANISM="Thalassiosira punctigera, Strain Tpunct2005C2" /NCGR_SAMPLE_ID=MMETSP1067 /ASSEMBLY_ACC=CAM_ASM_000444 /LENGTH=646 /DNA_ID=CAMNT_0013332283 /DNA_START=106 /DNA_END=2046 /DNA_ORIENTATION=-
MHQSHSQRSFDIEDTSGQSNQTNNISLPPVGINLMDTTDSTSNIDPSPLIGEGRDAGGSDYSLSKKGSDAGNGDALQAPQAPTWRHPVASTKTYFEELSGFFSWKFLSWLAIDQCCISGGSFALTMAMGLPLFKELGIGASRQQLYMSMIMSPWAMKPFIGVASDLFPIRGYNKRSFAIYSIVIGLIGCSMLLALYHSGAAETAVNQGEGAVHALSDIIVICFTAVSYEASTLDILGEGKYAELMRLHPESGSSIISFKFGWALFGTILTTTYVGPLADGGYWHVLFWIALVLSLTPFYPTWAGWIPEKLRTLEEPGMVKLCAGCLYDRGTFREKRVPFIVISLCGLSAPLLAALTTFADLAIGLAFAAMLITAFTVATYFIFPKTFFWVFLSITLSSVSWISIGSALGYYYTATEECVPDGPHFDYTYYITITGIVGSLVNFFAVVLYQNFLSTWRFRPVLIFTIVIGSLSCFVDLIIIMRWNVRLGIPDKLFFLLGNAVFENLVGILQSIPMSSIYAKIAPPGMESAVFAYTVGIANFCGMVSSLLGSGVIKWSGMVTVGNSCDFDALPYLIVMFRIMVPMLVGIPAAFMIPNVLQTENLIDWEAERWYEDRSGNVRPPESGTGTEDETSVEEVEDSRIEHHLL